MVKSPPESLRTVKAGRVFTVKYSREPGSERESK